MAAAVAGSRFSIREYAARARATGGSWPFGGAAGALPPMEVRRSRWWADEAAAVEEEEREVERRMAAKRRKRSVAELFAAVPRVAGGQGKRAVSGMQAKEKGKGKLLLAVGIKATKKKRKKSPIGIVEKSDSIKATSVSISPLFQDSVRKRNLTKSLGKKKRNREGTVLLEEESKKGNKNSILDNKKKVIKNSPQAQSMLHKQSKVGFSTLTDNTDATCKLNSPCKPKHVTFSCDIFGWNAHQPENNTEQPGTIQTSQQPSQEDHDRCSGGELQLVSQQADAIHGAVEEDTSSLSETVVSTGVLCTFPVAKPKDGTILGNSVDRNHCTEICTSSDNLMSINLACSSSKVPPQNFDGLSCHLDEGFSLDDECLCEENHVIPQGSSNRVSLSVKAVSGNVCRSILPQPSGSCLDDRRSTLMERMVTNRHLAKAHHKFVSSGKDLMSNISPTTGSKKSSDARSTDCAPARRNNYFSDHYVGLPLNSRGEFVNLHPGGTSSSVNISKRQCLGESSSRPSACPPFYARTTCMDHVNLRPNHHVSKNYTIDQSLHLTPIAPTDYGMDFRQLPPFSSKRMECHNPHQKLLGMQNCFMRQDCEQNTQSAAETTMRLMGKTVTLGASSIQCRGLKNGSPGYCKQTQTEDCSFQGTCRKAFPQSFHWDMADPPSAFSIPHGDRGLSENSCFLPAAELRSELGTDSFRTTGFSHQPELTASNNLYVQPATWCNEGVLRHQQPVMPNQVQSSAEDMLLVSMNCRNTQNVASVPCFNRRNSVRNFMEERPAPYQPGYFTQKFSSMTQRNRTSYSVSGYAAVQSTPGLTTQTKFTSLPPLPPSLAPSHVRGLDYALHRGGSNATTFHPPIPAVYEIGKPSVPCNAIFRDERSKWAMMGSNLEGLGHMNGNGKRPVGNDAVFFTLPKKPCTAAQKDLNLLPIPERGLQFCGSRPDAQPVDMPVGFGSKPQPDLRLGSGADAHTTWTYPVSMVRPVKLKSGARKILEPSPSSMDQGISVTPFAVENAASTANNLKNQDTEIYKF